MTQNEPSDVIGLAEELNFKYSDRFKQLEGITSWGGVNYRVTIPLTNEMLRIFQNRIDELRVYMKIDQERRDATE